MLRIIALLQQSSDNQCALHCGRIGSVAYR